MAATFLVCGESAGSAHRESAISAAATMARLLIYSLRVGRVNLRNSIHQELGHPKAEAPAILPEFELAGFLVLRRQKFHTLRLKVARQLEIDLECRRRDWFLVDDSLASGLFVARLLAIVIHAMKRDLIPRCRTRRRKADGFRSGKAA